MEWEEKMRRKTKWRVGMGIRGEKANDMKDEK